MFIVLSTRHCKADNLKKVEVKLIYNVVLVSSVQQRDSVIYIYGFFFFRLFSIIHYYYILSIVLCAVQ